MRMGNTKERIVDATAELFRRQGYTGTGVKQILADAEAPYGSLYHFFPGGKEELGAEVIRQSGEFYGRLVGTVWLAAPDVVRGVSNVFSEAGKTMVDTDYADACPIETVALEVASTNETLREATAEVFGSWITGATATLAANGIPKKKARELAIAVIALLEGAFVLARAMRTTAPLDAAGKTAAAAVKNAIP